MSEHDVDETEQDGDDDDLEDGQDGPEEPEPDPGPDALEPMLDLMEEIEAHRTRMKLLVQQGTADPQLVMQELTETVMSLLQDVANRSYDNLYELRRYLVEVAEPMLFPEDGDDDDDSAKPNGKLVFDAAGRERLVRVLYWVKTALGQGAQPEDPALRSAAAALEADVDALLQHAAPRAVSAPA